MNILDIIKKSKRGSATGWAKEGVFYLLAVGAIILGIIIIIVSDVSAVKNAKGSSEVLYAVIFTTVVSVAGTVLAYGGIRYIIDRSSTKGVIIQNQELRNQNKDLQDKNDDLAAANRQLRNMAPRLVEASFNPRLILYTGRMKFYDYYMKDTFTPAVKTGFLQKNIKASEEVLHSVSLIDCQKSIYLDLAQVKIKSVGNTVYIENKLPIGCLLNTEGENTEIVENVMLHLTKEEWDFDINAKDYKGESRGKTLEPVQTETYKKYHKEQSTNIIDKLKLINEEDARQYLQHAQMHLQLLLGSSGYNVVFKDSLWGGETLISFVEKHKQIR